MKKNLIIAVAVAGLMASCTKSKTETEKIENQLVEFIERIKRE